MCSGDGEIKLFQYLPLGLQNSLFIYKLWSIFHKHSQAPYRRNSSALQKIVNEAWSSKSNQRPPCFPQFPVCHICLFLNQTAISRNMCELHFTVGYIVQKVPGQHHAGGRSPSDGCGGRWQLFWNPVTYGLYSQRWGVRVTLWPDCCTSHRSPRLEFISHRSLFLKHRAHYVSPRFRNNTTTD